MAGRPRPRRPKFPLYHTFNNLSSKILHKITQIISPEIVHYSILYFEGGCGILSLSRGSERPRVRLADWVRVTEKKL